VLPFISSDVAEYRNRPRIRPAGAPQGSGASSVGIRMSPRWSPWSGEERREPRRGKSWSVILFEYFLLDKQEKVLRGLSKKVMGLQPN